VTSSTTVEFRCTAEEKRRLQALSRRFGSSASELLRAWVANGVLPERGIGKGQR